MSGSPDRSVTCLCIYTFFKKKIMDIHFAKRHDFHFWIMWKAVVFSPKAAVNIFLSEYNLHTKFAFLWPGVVIENKGTGNRENEQLLLLFNNPTVSS